MTEARCLICLAWDPPAYRPNVVGDISTVLVVSYCLRTSSLQVNLINTTMLVWEPGNQGTSFQCFDGRIYGFKGMYRPTKTQIDFSGGDLEGAG